MERVCDRLCSRIQKDGRLPAAILHAIVSGSLARRKVDAVSLVANLSRIGGARALRPRHGRAGRLAVVDPRAARLFARSSSSAQGGG